MTCGSVTVCFLSQGMHPAFIGAQYPFSVAAGPQPPMAATAVTFPGVPVPSMTQIAVHPYHTETGLPLSTTVAGPECTLCAVIRVFLNLVCIRYCTLLNVTTNGISQWVLVNVWQYDGSVMFYSRQCPLRPHYPGHTGSISALPLFPAWLIGQHSFSIRGWDTQPAYQPTGPALPAFCLQSWWEFCVIWFYIAFI